LQQGSLIRVGELDHSEFRHIGKKMVFSFFMPRQATNPLVTRHLHEGMVDTPSPVLVYVHTQGDRWRREGPFAKQGAFHPCQHGVTHESDAGFEKVSVPLRCPGAQQV